MELSCMSSACFQTCSSNCSPCIASAVPVVPPGHVEEGVVSLYSEEVGMWEYNLSGVGLKPGVMDFTLIPATLGFDGSSFVAWRNPFVESVKVNPKACFGCSADMHSIVFSTVACVKPHVCLTAADDYYK